MISAVNDMGVFYDNEEAARAAESEGLPIIPVSELPKTFTYQGFGWIDMIAKVASFEKVTEEDRNESIRQADEYCRLYQNL